MIFIFLPPSLYENVPLPCNLIDKVVVHFRTTTGLPGKKRRYPTIKPYGKKHTYFDNK